MSYTKYFITLLFSCFLATSYANDLNYINTQAQKGNAIAQYLLGIMYQQGKSVKQNDKTAITWYTKAAEQNYRLAQYALVGIYKYGKGTPASSEKVNYWYEKTQQPYSLTLLNKQQQQIKTIINHLLPLAIANHPNAQYLLANLYESNNQTEQANYWLLRAAMDGDKDAQYFIGLKYNDKQGFLNKTQGLYWLEKAAQQNFIDAEIVLASIYEKENDTLAPDLAKAAYWYEKAATQGNIEAQSFIALMYRDGKGVAIDKTQALKWFNSAAKQGDAFSQYNLGLMYEHGNGVKKNTKQAMYWYTLAAKQGHTASKLKLESLSAN